MEKGTHKTTLTMDLPARYRIMVKGGLDASWSDRLGGLRITVSNSEQGEALTLLTGELLDQAALLGVLNTLYNMQHPLISVHHLEMDEDRYIRNRLTKRPEIA
jgi:hypothetical protein